MYTNLLLVTTLIVSICCDQTRKNVLLIIVDDLRPNLGLYGYKNAFTPNIDRVFNNSFIFTNAFAQQALCAPSRNSFLTSRRPDSLHLYDFYSYWRESVGNFTTIPQFFKENGYYTQSIGKVFHPGKSSNFTDDAEYSWTGVPYHPSTEKYKEAKVCPTLDGKLARNLICPVILNEQPEGTLPDIESINTAVSFLKFSNKITKKPFFLALGLHKPHIPFKYPRKYLEHHPLDDITLPTYRWRPPLMPNVAWNPWTDVRHRDDITKLNVSFPFGHMPDNITRIIIQNYNAAVTYIDHLLGELFRYVENNTIVVFMADHGWSFGEHGEFSKFSNFDVATRVPFMIHVPKLNKNKIIIDNLVELVDLFPTLVDLTGVNSSIVRCPKNIPQTKVCTEGTSLVPVMKSYLKNENSKSKKAVFSQYPRPGTFPTLNPNSDKPRLKNIKIMGYSLRTKRYRYIEWIQFNHTTFKGNWTEVYDKELYDHQIDPDENMNLAYREDLHLLVKVLSKQLILGWRYF